jgi:flagellar L-ring protein precursor FlgH
MERPPLKPVEGSLWTEAVEASLYTEFRARRVGDIVTVRIVEDPKAELSANTKTSRSSAIKARMEFLGLVKKASEHLPTLPDDPLTEYLIDAAIDSEHDGKGSSARAGNVKAYVSCVVEQVLPNGYLFVRGTRQIWVNNEQQYILLSGTVRPEDINSKNEVASTYVADVEIVYAGAGPVADKQRTGWLGGIIDYVWPF